MKIIEALKELPLIDKKLEKNRQSLAEYASSVDGGTTGNTLKFPTKEEQTAEVAALIQSSQDLVSRKAKLRRALAITNAKVKVSIGGLPEKSIIEWIEYRQKGAEALRACYSSLSDNAAASKLNTFKFDGTQGVRIQRHYDEAVRNKLLEGVFDLPTKIDSTLELINAITDLIEEVA